MRPRDRNVPLAMWDVPAWPQSASPPRALLGIKAVVRPAIKSPRNYISTSLSTSLSHTRGGNQPISRPTPISGGPSVPVRCHWFSSPIFSHVYPTSTQSQGRSPSCLPQGPAPICAPPGGAGAGLVRPPRGGGSRRLPFLRLLLARNHAPSRMRILHIPRTVIHTYTWPSSTHKFLQKHLTGYIFKYC